MRKLRHSKQVLSCLVTAGPSYEELDQVRRLTNFSTGKLGCGLADYLSAAGHKVKILLGHYATHRDLTEAVDLDIFTTGENLRELLEKEKAEKYDAVFHAAAVGDFKFGQVFFRQEHEALVPLESGKFSTRHGTLFAELVPTKKILPDLRFLFPKSVIVGWKYEVDGDRRVAIQKGIDQARLCNNEASVVNGPAYGLGFGLVQGSKVYHFETREPLFAALEKLSLDFKSMKTSKRKTKRRPTHKD